MINAEFQDVEKINTIEPSRGITLSKNIEIIPPINSFINIEHIIYKVTNVTFKFDKDGESVQIYIKKHSSFADYLFSMTPKVKKGLRLL